MARVAVAYVEVRPNLNRFNTLLRDELAKTNPKIVLGVDKGALGSAQATITTAAERLNRRIESANVTHNNRMQAINDKMLKDQTDAMLALERDALQQKLAMQRENRKLQTADIDMLVSEEKAALRERTRFTAAENDELVRLNKQMIDQQIKDESAASTLRRTAARAAQSEAITDRRNQISETFRQDRAAAKMRESLVAGEARNAQKIRQRIDNEIVRQRIIDERAAAKVIATHSATDFATEYSKQFRKRFRKISQVESREFERQMVDRFGAVGATVAKRMLYNFNKTAKEGGRGAVTGFMRTFAGGMQGGTFARITRTLLRGMSGIADGMGALAEAGVKTLANGLATMVKPLGSVGESFGEIATQVGGTVAKGVGALVSNVIGLAAAAALAAVAVVGLNLVLGAVLAVVIPLVGGITALVAELTALGGAAVAGLGVLPGLAGAALAAFGPLMLVADRFEDLFENTTKKTGPLFVALEHLKNAIWAVMSTGFLQAVRGFVSGTLPQLLGGIEAVSAAWGRLLTGLVKLASSKAAVSAFNALLQAGAQIVGWLAQMIGIVGPALLTMATTALPAITAILGAVGGMVQAFADWVAQVSASGQMATVFQDVAVIVGQLAQLFPPLAELMSVWITNLLPPVAQFITLLQAMVGQWLAIASSAQGMALIQNFFLAMNTIVAAFQPLLIQVVGMFLQFGPTLAALTTTAIPALQALLGTLMNLATAVAPAVMTFLQAFTTALSDPAVQAAVTALGMAFGELITSLTAGAPMFESVITFITLLLRILAPILTVLMSVLNVLMPLINILAAVLVPVLDLLLKILQPVIDLFDWLAGLLNKAVEPVLKAVTWALEKVAQALQWFWDNLVKSLQKIGEWIAKVTGLKGPLDWLGNKLSWLGDKMGLTGDKSKALAETSDRSFDAMGKSIVAVANTSAWSTIGSNAQAVGDYLVDMANNGIAGNEKLIQSMAAMGAAAYAAKNETDIATFEKNVTKAYTGANPNLYRATAKKTGYTIGTVAGSAFNTAYNAEVNTAFDVAAKNAATAGRKTAAGYISTFKPALSKLSSFTIIKGHKAFDSGKEIANYLAKGITSGSKNIARVSRYIQKTFGKDLTKIVAKNKSFWDNQKKYSKALPDFAKKMKTFTSGAQLDAYLLKWQKHWDERLKAIKEFKSSAVDALTKGANMVGHWGFIPTPAEVKGQLDALYNQMTTFTTNLANLQKLGLSKELAAQWLQSGVEGAGNMVAGLQGATEADIAEINAKFAKIGDTAGTVADTQATAYFGVGEATVQGYINGISSMRNAASKEMTGLIDHVYKEVKKKLGVKSPSTVFAGLGVNTMAGYVKGVASMQKATLQTVGGLYAAVTAVPAATLATPNKMRIPAANMGGLHGVGAGAPVVNVKVYLGTKEITDIVRTEVQVVDNTRARQLLAGRRGG